MTAVIIVAEVRSLLLATDVVDVDEGFVDFELDAESGISPTSKLSVVIIVAKSSVVEVFGEVDPVSVIGVENAAGNSALLVERANFIVVESVLVSVKNVEVAMVDLTEVVELDVEETVDVEVLLVVDEKVLVDVVLVVLKFTLPLFAMILFSVFQMDCSVVFVDVVS